MSKLDLIRALFDYHYALNDRLLECVDMIDEEQLLKESNYSHGSVRNHLVHIAQTDIRWMLGMQSDPGSRQFQLDPEDFPDKRSTKALLDETAAKVTAWVDTLKEEQLEQTLPGFGGPMWHSLLHIVNHGTDHRAQVLSLLDGYSAPTFEQDLIMHLWSRN